MGRQIIVQSNRADGNFHQLILLDVIKFSSHNNMTLRGFNKPQNVISAHFMDKAPFPIANFYSLEARNNTLLQLLNGKDEVTYNDFYDEIYEKNQITELIKYSSVGTFSKYFKFELKRIMDLHSMNSHLDLFKLDLFKSMDQRFLLNLLHGRYVGNQHLPSIDDISRSLRTPSTIIKYGISPAQFFNYLFNEKDS